LELKREHLIIRATKRDPWQENPLSSMLTQHNFCIDDGPLETLNHQPHAITESVCGVNVSKQYDGELILSFNKCGSIPLGVNVLRKSGG
jgi:hypothetical protein